MTTPEKLYCYVTLLRHGETEANVQNIIQGHMDTELSPVGLRQAQELRGYMNSVPIDLILSSDLKRANMTAKALELSAPLEEDSRLRERNFGQYCGAARSELQAFAERNAQTGGGCDGWRAVGGECSHEMAHRTSNFLMDLCSRLAQCLHSEKTLPHCNSGTARSPIFPRSSVAPMPEPVQDCFKGPSNPVFQYAGHVLIVSHGGWIRHFLRLIALQSEHSLHFPKQCVNSVMRNCGICQIGIAFDVARFRVFQTQQPVTRPILNNRSPLPVFGTLLESPEEECRCPFFYLAHQRFPLFTVCYHFNLVKSDLDAQKRNSKDLTHTVNKEADSLCAQMEIIFSDDGDEYAGLPQQAHQNGTTEQ